MPRAVEERKLGFERKRQLGMREIREEVALGDPMRRLPSILSWSALGAQGSHRPSPRVSGQGAGWKAPEGWRSPSELF